MAIPYTEGHIGKIRNAQSRLIWSSRQKGLSHTLPLSPWALDWDPVEKEDLGPPTLPSSSSCLQDSGGLLVRWQTVTWTLALWTAWKSCFNGIFVPKYFWRSWPDSLRDHSRVIQWVSDKAGYRNVGNNHSSVEVQWQKLLLQWCYFQNCWMAGPSSNHYTNASPHIEWTS